ADRDGGLGGPGMGMGGQHLLAVLHDHGESAAYSGGSSWNHLRLHDRCAAGVERCPGARGR
ncbi:unnamed protein product, partial [Effrenium voratum]